MLLGFGVQARGSGVQGSGFRVQGSGSRFQVLGSDWTVRLRLSTPTVDCDWRLRLDSPTTADCRLSYLALWAALRRFGVDLLLPRVEHGL